MDVSKERTQILRMIQRGHITAEEGAEILDALQKAEVTFTRHRTFGGRGTARQLRIRVTDLRESKHSVDFALPLSMVGVGAKMGARFTRDEIRLEDFREAIERGITGKILDLTDEEKGERIEIFVE
jgi:hypothetical protein